MALKYESYLTGLLVLLVLFLVTLRFYRKFIAPYTVFPYSSLLLNIFCYYFFKGKLSKNTTRSTYLFQAIINDCKKAKYGFHVVWVLLAPVLFVFNEEAVKILSNEEAALNKSWMYAILAEGLRTGLGVSKAELWRKRRKMIQPAFHISVLKNHVASFNKNSVILVQQLLTVANEPFDAGLVLKMSAMNSMFETIFGLELTGVIEEAEAEHLIKVIDRLGAIVMERILNPLLYPKLMLPFTATGRECTKKRIEMWDIIEKILLRVKDSVVRANSERTDSSEKDEDCFRPLRRSFSETIVRCHMQDPSGFSMEDMKDEISSVMIGGYETVANCVRWCLFLLGNHPEIQDEMYDEVEHLTGRDISYEDVQGLTYTECIIKETLRLYPTVPVYARYLEKDVQCGKYNIPKGTNFAFFPYMLHRNAEVYPNPERFDPERFRKNSNKNPWSYTPFSEGIRNCIGKNFAMLEAKIMLAHIIRDFTVASLDRVEDIQVGWEIVLAANPPIRLCFTPRSHISHQG